MENRIEKIKKMQKEKDVVILAHYYVDGAVQEIADYVGDSFYLSKVATQVTQQNILFCGVILHGRKCQNLKSGKERGNGRCPRRLPNGTYGYGRTDRTGQKRKS